MNLNQRIAGYRRKLTPSELLLIESLQTRYPQGLLESATSLAASVGTSASTVVRLLAKLGYASYAEAQMEARTEVTTRLASPMLRASAGIVDDLSTRACLQNALLHDQRNLATTFAGIDEAAFEQAVRLLTAARARVHVLGQRHGAMLAGHLALHLNLCLPDVRALTSTGPLPIEDQMLRVDAHDVLLLVTMRRHALAIARAARHFRDQGAQVIAITDSPAAEVAQMADPCFIVHTSSASPFDSYTAALSLCNALVTAVGQRRRKELAVGLERAEALARPHWDEGKTSHPGGI